MAANGRLIMASFSALKAQLDALEKRIPAPPPSVAITHWIVSPNPEPGGPPVVEGIAERTTTQIPGPGYPAIEERWKPWVTDLPAPLTKADAAQFFKLIGQGRHERPADIAARAVRGFVLWQNAPGGPAVARYGRDGIEVVRLLWPQEAERELLRNQEQCPQEDD